MKHSQTSSYFFISPEFAKINGIKHAFFTRNLPGSTHAYVGNTFDRLKLEGNKEETLRLNREIVKKLSPFKISGLSFLHQTHSNRVVVASAHEGMEQNADAQATTQPGLALGVLTADCVPALFADGENRIIGSAHAGWKGALGGVLENTVLEMCKLGTDTSRISAVIGPCIRQESYEVGPEFVERFIQDSKENLIFFKPNQEAGIDSGKMLFDLPGYVSHRLAKLDLKAIYDTGLNTFSDRKNFFSFRASTLENRILEGNLVSIIEIA